MLRESSNQTLEKKYWVETGQRILVPFRICCVIGILLNIMGAYADLGLLDEVHAHLVWFRAGILTYSMVGMGLSFLWRRGITKYFQELFSAAIIINVVPLAVVSARTGGLDSYYQIDIMQLQMAFITFLPTNRKIGISTILITGIVFFVVNAIWAPESADSVVGIVNVLVTMVICLFGHHVILSNRLESYIKNAALDKANLDLEQKSLQLKINPHFFFNALTSIQRFTMTNDKDEATSYLTKFARLMRQTLNHARTSFVPLDEELESMRLYAELELLPYRGKHEFKMNVDSRINTANLEVVPMLMQPFIENAIKHGIHHKNDGGLVQVSIVLQDGQLQCTVEDNGIGRKKAMALGGGGNHDSAGQEITTSRLELIHRMLGTQSNFLIEDLHDDFRKPMGTRVSFVIPSRRLNIPAETSDQS